MMACHHRVHARKQLFAILAADLAPAERAPARPLVPPFAVAAVTIVVAGAGAPPRRTQELERALRKTGIALLAWLLIVTNQITHKTNTCTKTSVSIKTSVSVKNL